MFHIKSTAYQSDCSTSKQSTSAGRKVSKPLKIAELLGSRKQSKNGQTNSAVKIRLPERITTHLKNASSRRKNETNIHVQLSHNKKNVRRNLNFTKIPTPTFKVAAVTNRNSLNEEYSLKEENSHLSTRKSFLLPPNTVKEFYIKNKQNKSVLPLCTSTYSVCDNKNPRISEKSEACSSPVRVISTRIDPVIHEKVGKTVIQHTSSQMFTMNQSGIGILHSDCTDAKNDAVRKETPEVIINVEEKKSLSMTTNNYKEDQSTRDVQIINQPYLDLIPSTNKNDEYVTLNKTTLTDLVSKLNHDICRLEEDILPNLKFTFTAIMNILSTINVTNKISDNNDTKIVVQQMTENLNDHIKIMSNIKKKSLCVINNINIEDNTQEAVMAERSINIENSNIPKEIYKTPDTRLMKFVNTNGKNNSRIQSLCQIDLTPESNKENDSFVDLEKKLDITNIKSNTTIVSLKKSIPMSHNKKEEKPLKEYMALKSRMSCLLTPNIKHFNYSQSENDHYLPSESGDAKACLSGKILAELYNLYED